MTALGKEAEIVAPGGSADQGVAVTAIGDLGQFSAGANTYARRSGLLPSGAIIDGKPVEFCSLLSKS